MRFIHSVFLCAGACLSAFIMPSNAYAEDSQSYKVELNKTEILRLPRAASSIIIGNPKIADVTVQSSDVLFVIGRGFGETNLIILDANGSTMMDADLQVVNSLPSHGVRLYNGKSRETYSCIPYCGPSPVLGDNPAFIRSNTAEEQRLNSFTAFGPSTPPVSNGGGQNQSLEPAGPPPQAAPQRPS